MASETGSSVADQGVGLQDGGPANGRDQAGGPSASSVELPTKIEETGGRTLGRDAEPGGEGGGRYVGQPLKRNEDLRLLTGRGRYVDDIHVDSMLHARFVRSPIAHARIVSIDTSRAEAARGVVKVLTGAQLAEVVAPLRIPAEPHRPEVRTVARPVLAYERVRFQGEAVAVVVAEDPYLAEDAAEQVEVEWEPLPAVVDPQDSIREGAPQLHDDVPSNNVGHIVHSHGDCESAFRDAPHVFSKKYRAARNTAAALEARGSIASYDRNTGQLMLWTSSQMPHLVRTNLAAVLGIPESSVRVDAPDVGGGFGNKSNLFIEDVTTCAISRMLGRPIKWIEDRVENLAASYHAKEVICEVEAAVDEQGMILALRGKFVGDAGAYSVTLWTGLLDAMGAASLLPGVYDVRNLDFEVDAALTNKCLAAAYRGVGNSAGQAVRELLLDEIARGLEIDPVELRLRNCIPSDYGYVSATGMRYDGGSYRESIERCAELIDYEGTRERQAELRREGRYIGIGFSAFVEPTAFGIGGAKVKALPMRFYDAATVTVEPDGSVTVSTGLHSHGQGHETSFAQIAADAVGARFEQVTVKQGDTATTPFGSGTYSSRGAVMGYGSITAAAKEVRATLVAMAAAKLGVEPQEIELGDGVARSTLDPGKRMTLAEIAEFSYWGGIERPEGVDPTLSATRNYTAQQTTYSNGCTACVVEVDIETGLVDVQSCVAVEDCGVVINPMIVDGQVIGGIAQGIGSALYEDLVYDEDGNLMSSTLLDYLYPSAMEIPEIVVDHLETPSDVTEGGVKGMGEGGTIAAPAAVANAVADALSPFGARIEQTPIGPNQVLDAIARAGDTREDALRSA